MPLIRRVAQLSSNRLRAALVIAAGAIAIWAVYRSQWQESAQRAADRHSDTIPQALPAGRGDPRDVQVFAFQASSGGPIAHCKVLLGEPEALEFGIPVTADAQGRLAIPRSSLTPGRTLYALAVIDPGRVLWLHHPVGSATAVPDAEITLQFPPEAAVTLVVELEKDRMPLEGGQIRTVVLPQDDGPASEAFLELAERLNLLAATPDENGRCPAFRLSVGLEIGISPSAGGRNDTLWSCSSETMPAGVLIGSFGVTTPGPHTVRIRRARSTTLQVRLVDERGDFLPGVSLAFQYMDLGNGREELRTASLRTDEKGEASLQVPGGAESGESAAGPWSWWAIVDRPGQGRSCVQGRTQGVSGIVEIALESTPGAGDLHGQILSILDGAPLKDLPLHVRLGGVTLGVLRSDEEGKFRLPAAALPPTVWLSSRPAGQREFRVFLKTPLIGHTQRWARAERVELPDFMRGIQIRENDLLTIRLHPGPPR